MLDDVTVSRRHAVIDCDDGRCVLTDVGSFNGTYVNADRIEGPRVLRHGDQVQVGAYKFVFCEAAI